MSHRAPAPGEGADEAELDVTVVLPVYNEKGHLQTEIDRISAALEASPYSFEIVVVDDGSDDGSGEELRRIEGIRLLQFSQNRGSGSVRKAGTHAARGRVVVWNDADMTGNCWPGPTSACWCGPAARFRGCPCRTATEAPADVGAKRSRRDARAPAAGPR